MPRKQTHIHRNSLLGLAQINNDRGTAMRIISGQRRADIDLMLLNRWARNGFVSVPGNLGPVDADGGENG